MVDFDNDDDNILLLFLLLLCMVVLSSFSTYNLRLINRFIFPVFIAPDNVNGRSLTGIPNPCNAYLTSIHSAR